MKKRVLILLVAFILLDLWSVSAQSNQAGQTAVCTDPKKFNWFIQIDINDHSSAECMLKYSDEERKIRINSDMTLDGNAGSCLDKAYGGYWLKIKESCLDKKFSISCDKDFISALVYNSAGSETVYVSSVTHSADSGGTTNEEVSEICEIKAPGRGDGENRSCISAGYYCRDREECLDDNGNVLGGYNCPEGKSCCNTRENTREKEETCEEKRGSICAANQECNGGRIVRTAGEECCVGGVCENVDVANRCEEEANGSCKSSCGDDEKEIDENCPDSGDKCCIEKGGTNGGEGGISPILIIILIVLIFLVVLGIIFRHKLQIWLYSRRAGGAVRTMGGGVPPRGPGVPPRAFGGMPQIRPRYVPPGMPRGPGPALRQTRGVKTQADKEMEETMRKLKEMGK